MSAQTEKALSTRAESARKLAGGDSPEALTALITRALALYGDTDATEEGGKRFHILTVLPGCEHDLYDQEMLVTRPREQQDHLRRTLWLNGDTGQRVDDLDEAAEIICDALLALYEATPNLHLTELFQALTETGADYAEFDHTPRGATITFITRSRARQGVIISFTDRSMDVHCNDGTHARLTRARWGQRQVRMGDLTHRERKEAGERIGLGATLDQETNPWIREVLIDLASTGAHLASVPDSWIRVPGVTGFIAQWRPTHDHREPGCIRITQVLNGEEVRDDGFAALNTARNHLIRLGWKVDSAGHGGMLITLEGPTPRF